MRADNEFLLALSSKLQEIADNTADMDTQQELNEFIDAIMDSVQ